MYSCTNWMNTMDKKNLQKRTGLAVHEPDFKVTASGYKLCKLELETKDDIIRCIAWGDTAEKLRDSAIEGEKITVWGHQKDDDGFGQQEFTVKSLEKGTASKQGVSLLAKLHRDGGGKRAYREYVKQYAQEIKEAGYRKVWTHQVQGSVWAFYLEKIPNAETKL